MQVRLGTAERIVSQPLSESERRAGWTDEVLGWVRKWLNQCATDLAKSPHPKQEHVVHWVKAWDGMPGLAFDPRHSDPLTNVILDASSAVNVVFSFEKLYSQVRTLERDLRESPADSDLLIGVDRIAVNGIVDALDHLGGLLDGGHRLREQDVYAWRDSLVRSGARWQDRYGNPWPGVEAGPRFWTEQSGRVWDLLGGVDRGLERLEWMDSR
jgi:hypothetical protein